MKAVQLDNLNKTPVRTKKWLNINDISLGNLNINESEKFDNVKITRYFLYTKSLYTELMKN